MHGSSSIFQFVRLLSSMSVSIQENGAMMVGMGLFVVLNYTGQKYFTFSKNNNKEG